MFLRLGNGQQMMVADLEMSLKVLQETHPERMRKLGALRSEIQMLLDRIVDLKKSEESYLSSLGIEMEDAIQEDGGPSRNVLTTLPDMGLNSRAHSASKLKRERANDSLNLNARAQLAHSDQDVKIAQEEILTTLRDEDRVLRRYRHLIMNTFLIAQKKYAILEKMTKEKDRVGEGNV